MPNKLVVISIITATIIPMAKNRVLRKLRVFITFQCTIDYKSARLVVWPPLNNYELQVSTDELPVNATQPGGVNPDSYIHHSFLYDTVEITR